jgi:hypothetical protein
MCRKVSCLFVSIVYYTNIIYAGQRPVASQHMNMQWESQDGLSTYREQPLHAIRCDEQSNYANKNQFPNDCFKSMQFSKSNKRKTMKEDIVTATATSIATIHDVKHRKIENTNIVRLITDKEEYKINNIDHANNIDVSIPLHEKTGKVSHTLKKEIGRTQPPQQQPVIPPLQQPTILPPLLIFKTNI